jgi:chitinase
LAFVNIFPSEGNGWPGTNFGNQCGAGVYSGPGYHGVVQHANDHLLSNCPNLAADIPVCQATYGKKIILSLGGGLGDYQVLGVADGTAFADFLWGAFGPYNATWSAQNLPRPFDGPGKKTVEVDGFDFDIEVRPSGKYVEC